MTTILSKLKKKVKKSFEVKENINPLMEAAGLTKSEANKKLLFIEKIPNITFEQYLNEKLYLIPDKDVVKARKMVLVELVSEQYDIPFGEVYAKMGAVKKKYGISYYLFVERKVIECTAENEIQKVADYLLRIETNHVRRVSEATGWSKEKSHAEMQRIKEKHKIGYMNYYDDQLFLCTDAEIEEKASQKSKRKKADIQRVIDATGWPKRQVNKHMYKCRAIYNISSEYYMIFKCWELTDEEIDGYARARLSRVLSEKYNPTMGNVLNNKYIFDQTYKDYIMRKFWINRDTNFEEFAAFAGGLTELFCKPVDLSCGTGMGKIKVEGDLHALYQELMGKEKLLVEECVQQHSQMADIFPGCVNTVRVVTLQENDQCHTICSFVRFGCDGVTDNFGSGGVLAAVDVETGKIITKAIDKKGNLFEDHPVTGKKIFGFAIPHWDLVREITESALRSQPSVNYVGWDVAICPEKVVLIEGNSRPDLGAYQAAFADVKKGQKYLVDAYL